MRQILVHDLRLLIISETVPRSLVLEKIPCASDRPLRIGLIAEGFCLVYSQVRSAGEVELDQKVGMLELDFMRGELGTLPRSARFAFVTYRRWRNRLLVPHLVSVFRKGVCLVIAPESPSDSCIRFCKDGQLVLEARRRLEENAVGVGGVTFEALEWVKAFVHGQSVSREKQERTEESKERAGGT